MTTTYTSFRLSNPDYHAVYQQPNSTLSYPISGHKNNKHNFIMLNINGLNSV
jgi:hypothetical protein